ncbi:flagellar hook-length control protein FliK [Breoghania sp.]|uniref:flagellar hook-length control protein FliK n=1 Tax=Breoghania sp. TaxID=2065378 RepID=UPI002AAAAD26|nr:flagellar hook-length control protein FliK [Breoghania sp.]
MLTFETMMSIDPAMGGFASSAGVSGFGAAASGNPQAASGQFAAQLSGVMSNEGAATGNAGQSGAAAIAADGAANSGKSAATGFGITLQLSDEAEGLATPETAFVQAVLQSADVAVDPATGEVADDGEEPAEGETSDEVLAAALASGLAVTPEVTVPAPVEGEAGIVTVADDDGAGVDPLAAGKAGAADAEGELELPTFFPSVNRAARGKAADGGSVGDGEKPLVNGAQGNAGPAKAEAKAALTALSADEVAAATNAATNGATDGETDLEAALRALLSDRKGDAVRQSSGATPASDQAAVDGRQAAAADGGDDLAARAQKRLVGGMETASSGTVDDEALDEALISLKATRANVSATTSNAGANAAEADDSALGAAAAKAVQRIAGGQAGEGDGEAAVGDAPDSDPADEPVLMRPKGAMPRTDEQAAAKLATGKVATSSDRLAGEGDPRIANFSSATDVSDEGEVSLKGADKNAAARPNAGANANAGPHKQSEALVSMAAMAGAATHANVDGDETKSLDPMMLGATLDPAATNSRAMDTQAARLAQTAQGTGSALPTAMVAAEIARNAQRGVSRFEIRLDPPELGRVDVHLKINDDGKVQAHLVVERRDTLDMFMRDQRGMERALENAGLKTNADGGLQFSLKDQGQSFAGRDGNQNGNGTQAAGLNKEAAGGEAAEATLMPERISAYSRNGVNGVDIRI